MHLCYTHGLGGSLQAQPEIEAVFAPLGYTVTRIPVPSHHADRRERRRRRASALWALRI